MSKTFKGKTCVYCCAENSSTTGDHVLARSFFLKKFRADLPKVPSCGSCNGAKSELEHYLATVLPFSNRHEDSSSILAEDVPSRLVKNAKLYRELRAGMCEQWRFGIDGVLRKEMTLPFDGSKLERLFKKVAQGLGYWHWDLLLPPDKCDITGGFLVPEGKSIVEHLLAVNAAKRVKQSIGGGAFEYEGVQAFDRPEITIWRMTMYNSIFGESVHSPSIRVSQAYVSTAPKGKALPIDS